MRCKSRGSILCSKQFLLQEQRFMEWLALDEEIVDLYRAADMRPSGLWYCMKSSVLGSFRRGSHERRKLEAFS